MADGNGCTCGSGAHPRPCALHPELYAEHLAELAECNCDCHGWNTLCDYGGSWSTKKPNYGPCCHETKSFIRKLEDIDLDFLKRQCQRIYYFGLGFIQVKLNEVERLHFYSEELPVICEDIHDHRYAFNSLVLKGTLKNKRWLVAPGESHVLRYENCSPNKVSLPEESCYAVPGLLQIVGCGQPYSMLLDEFHQVEGRGCVTYLRRGEVERELAKIVLPKGAESVCPFSLKFPEEELWAMVGRML